jgi:hypothetical protein
MAFQYDPSQQQGQFSQENNGNGMQQPGPPNQGMAPPPGQQMQQQGGQEGGSPAPFAQQGGVEGSTGSVSGDAKTTLWYVYTRLLIHLTPPSIPIPSTIIYILALDLRQS